MIKRIGEWLVGKKGATDPNDGKEAAPSDGSGRMPPRGFSADLDTFYSSIEGVGHPEYPILDKKYCPASRVPCTDLVPLISKLIAMGDAAGIKKVMRSVIEANPGLGAGSSGIDKKIDRLLSIRFEDFLSFESPSGLSELKAMFIVALKDGGGREFLIKEEIPRLMSWACIAHHPLWTDQLQILSKKANSWLSLMAKEAPFWVEYEMFDVRELPKSSVEKQVGLEILKLSPAARLQLFNTIVRGSGSIMSRTTYPIRSLGINVENTSEEIINSGLVVYSSSKEVIKPELSKDELQQLCEANGIDVRKSWNKEMLVDALSHKAPECLEQVAKSKGLVAVNYEAYPNLSDVADIAEKHLIGFKLLCFS